MTKTVKHCSTQGGALAPLKHWGYQDGGFGGHQMGGGEFGASARGATEDLPHNFCCYLSLFTFCLESESSFVSTSLANVEITFSSWKGRWAESTRKCGFDQFRNIGWKRKLLEWNFALLLSERNNTWQVWNTCLLSMHSTVYKGTTWVYLFQRAQWIILHSICIWDITKVLRHQYFRGLLKFPISK